MKQDSDSFILIFDKVFRYIVLTCAQKLPRIIQTLQTTFSLSANRLFSSEHISIRSGRPEVFCKRVVLKNFADFRGKHLCQGLFLNTVAVYEIFKNTLFYRTPMVATFEALFTLERSFHQPTQAISFYKSFSA